MTSNEKDQLCDNNYDIIQELIKRNEQRLKQKNDLHNTDDNRLGEETTANKFKRHLTSTSQYDDEVNFYNDDDNTFTTVTNKNKRKQMKTNDKQNSDNNDLYIIEDNITHNTNRNGGRLFVNSKNKLNNNTYIDSRSYDMNHHGRERRSLSKNVQNKNESPSLNESLNQTNLNNNRKTNQNYNYNNNNNNSTLPNEKIVISQHALNYAIEQHLPPIHINCSPKLDDHQKGKELIKALFAYIEKDFRKLNKHFNMPLGFEYWFIGKNGNLTCFTRHTELFVYLCDPSRYPSSLISIDISPNRPKHLPCQNTLLLKFVPNDFTLDDIKNEIAEYVISIYNLEDMIGTKNDKSRHVRLEVQSSDEYEQLMKKGGITIDGHFIELQEFLAPPRLLICSKCNEPGHIRKNCTLSYDACRRCGQDKSIGEHKECIICCHRCKSDHMATDYKCSFLIEYRKSLVAQLKNKPHLLPPNIQIFIPTECRERGDKYNKLITNPLSKTNKYSYNNRFVNQYNRQLPYNKNAYVWPPLDNRQSCDNKTLIDENAIWNELKNKQMEIENLKHEFNTKIQNCQLNYNENIEKLKSVMLIIAAQTKYQNENIEKCQIALGEFTTLISSTVDAIKLFTTNRLLVNSNENTKDDSQKLLQQISKSIECIQERNNLLISSQKSLNNLIEQQGQLLFQAVNSLSVNNDQ